MSTQSGGYDVELFVETPDYDLICTICQGVLRCPVRAACHHIFCKKCILQWLKRYYYHQCIIITGQEHCEIILDCLLTCAPQWRRVLIIILCRQETCPCCRKPVNPNLIFVMFKLSKSIGRLKIKVGSWSEVRHQGSQNKGYLLKLFLLKPSGFV